jgi:hypothetical protein
VNGKAELWEAMQRAQSAAIKTQDQHVAIGARALERAYRRLFGNHVPVASDYALPGHAVPGQREYWRRRVAERAAKLAGGMG